MIIKLLKPFSFLPALFLMYMIYSFSAQEGDASAQLSYSVSYKIVEIGGNILGADLQDWEIAKLADRFNGPVRKLAHMTEYFALAVAVAFPLYVYGLRGILLLIAAGIICVGFACGDEYHQSQVAGRGPSKRDVLIDSFGVFWGIILVRIIGWTGRNTIFRPFARKKKKRQEDSPPQQEPDAYGRPAFSSAGPGAYGRPAYGPAGPDAYGRPAYGPAGSDAYGRPAYGPAGSDAGYRQPMSAQRRSAAGGPAQRPQTYAQMPNDIPRSGDPRKGSGKDRRPSGGYTPYPGDYSRQPVENVSYSGGYASQTGPYAPYPGDRYAQSDVRTAPRQGGYRPDLSYGYPAEEDYDPEESIPTSDYLSEDMSFRKLVSDLKDQNQTRRAARRKSSAELHDDKA